MWDSMRPWLSHVMDVGPSCTYCISTKIFLSQTAFFMQWLVTMYSTFVVVMVDCFLHFHKLTPKPIRIRVSWRIVGRLHIPPTLQWKIISRQFPCLWGIIWSPKCPSNTSWYVSQPSNAEGRPRHEMPYYIHHKWKINPRTHHCMQKKILPGIIWNILDIPLLILKFLIQNL
jgi:hypothetical protein